MYKKIINGFIEHPIATSIFVIDFSILVFHKPPFFFAFLMLGALAASCMFLGQKIAPFK